MKEEEKEKVAEEGERVNKWAAEEDKYYCDDTRRRGNHFLMTMGRNAREKNREGER